MDTYEKKYNEAMLRADEAVQKGCLDKDMFDIIFPPEESEDERIRKEIKDIVLSYRSNCVYEGTHHFDECLAWLEKQKEEEGYEAIPVESTLEYKLGFNAGKESEKQKESLHISETCKENADSFTSEKKEQKPELVQQPPITYTYNSNASRDERLKAALLALLNSDLLKVKEGGYFTKQDLIEWVERIPTDKPVAWSEEDKKILDDVSHILIGLNYKQIAKDYKQAVEKLIYARPSWKPSEEHLSALLAIFNDPNNIGSQTCQLALSDLYDQLKKL